MRTTIVTITMLPVLGCAAVPAPRPAILTHRVAPAASPVADPFRSTPAPVPVPTSTSATATATATASPAEETGLGEAIARLSRGDPPPAPVALGERQWVRAELEERLAELGEVNARQVPDSFVAEVHRALDWLVSPARGREWFARSLSRMDRHSSTVRAAFAERNLPRVLDYLALVESGYVPTARSHAGAAGLWQFMPATARRYGLEVGRRQDDRLDPAKATLAAREYLLDLLLEFGGGHGALLAMASYNAGEGRVRGGLRKLDDLRDRAFWTISAQGLLPKETRGYVPMILAAAIAAENRARYGLAPARPDPAQAIPVPIASAAPAERPTVRSTGAAKRRPQAPPPPPKLRYAVRRGNTASSIAAAFGLAVSAVVRAAGGPKKTLAAGQILELPVSGWQRTLHRVAKGQSLEGIARTYGTSVHSLRVFNGLPTTRIRSGEWLAIYRRAKARSQES